MKKTKNFSLKILLFLAISSFVLCICTNSFAATTSLTEKQRLAADVNGDKIINQKDLNLISQKLAGGISKFPVQDYIPGDLDSDRKITNKDYMTLYRAVMGHITLTDKQRLAADVNGDRTVGTMDMILLSQKLSGRISKLPVQDYIPGDLTGDRNVNSQDSLTIYKAIIGSIRLTDKQRLAADVNGDGKVTSRDYNLILMRNYSSSYKFPVEDFIPGDLDGDKKVTNKDYAILLQYYTYINTPGQVTNVRSYISGRNLSVHWNSVSGADGYEVVFTSPGTNIKWTYDKKYTNISFSNFPARSYVVRIKAYKILNGKKVYGKESNAIGFAIR